MKRERSLTFLSDIIYEHTLALQKLPSSYKYKLNDKGIFSQWCTYNEWEHDLIFAISKGSLLKVI